MKLLSLTLAINAHITAQTSVENEQKITAQKRKRRAKYLLIADALKQAIKQGQVVPNEALPSARTLATQLNVNRHTIMAAVAELVAQGWIEAKERSGYRVVNKLPIQTSKAISQLTVEHQTFDWQFRHKKVTAIAPTKGASAYKYNFAGGQPDNRLFPFNEFKHYFSQLCQHPQFTQLGYDNNVGETDLITQVSTYLRRVRSITDKEIMICNGSQEGLYMVSKLLLQAGDKVAVEQFGYPPAWAAFKSSGAELVVIQQDNKGIIPEYLAAQLAQGNIKLIYLTPLHQYPTTVTLDVSRRMQIYQLAAQYGVAIIEDDYDHEFHYDSQPIAPMAADDPLGLVIYISTFSKLMFGGARIGYVVANNALITELTAYKTLMNHKSNVLMQQAVAKWMQRGGFESHLRRMTRCYHKRRDFLVNLLRNYQQQGLPITFDCPAGGMALWVDMGVSIVGLKQTLLTKDVYLQTEVEFNLITEHLIPEQNKSQYRFIRVGFASMSEVEITQGMKIIVQELYG